MRNRNKPPFPRRCSFTTAQNNKNKIAYLNLIPMNI